MWNWVVIVIVYRVDGEYWKICGKNGKGCWKKRGVRLFGYRLDVCL